MFSEASPGLLRVEGGRGETPQQTSFSPIVLDKIVVGIICRLPGVAVRGIAVPPLALATSDGRRDRSAIVLLFSSATEPLVVTRPLGRRRRRDEGEREEDRCQRWW